MLVNPFHYNIKNQIFINTINIKVYRFLLKRVAQYKLH